MKSFYQRVSGYMCVLLLLQQFHVVLLGNTEIRKHVSHEAKNRHKSNKGTSQQNSGQTWGLAREGLKVSSDKGKDQTNIVKGQNDENFQTEIQENQVNGSQLGNDSYDTSKVLYIIRRLLDKVQDLRPDLETRVHVYMPDCSVDRFGHVEDMWDNGSPMGVLVRLIVVMIFELRGCKKQVTHHLHGLADIADQDTLTDVMGDIYEIVEELVNFKEAENNKRDSIQDGNWTETDAETPEEDVLFSEVLAKQLLNTEELIKVFEVLANGEFDNVTDVENFLSETDIFNPEETSDTGYFNWTMRPPPPVDLLSMQAINVESVRDFIGNPFVRKHMYEDILENEPRKENLDRHSPKELFRERRDILEFYDDPFDIENAFFIMNSRHYCKVLGIDQQKQKYTFQDFSETNVMFQLWSWNEDKLVNVGTKEALEVWVSTNSSESEDNLVVAVNLWSYDNISIAPLQNQSCDLVASSEEELTVECFIWSDQIWDLVTYRKQSQDEFTQSICTFFIQTILWPCEFVTASTFTKSVSVTPLSDNVSSQLWFWSEGRLVHAESGMALADKEGTRILGLDDLNSTEVAEWRFTGGRLCRDEYIDSCHAATLGTLQGVLYMPGHLQRISGQKWKLISARGVALGDHSLSCESDINNVHDQFVIRNSKVSPCLLLTVVEKGGRFELEMKGPDISNLDKQTWIQYLGVLINLESGLSIAPENEDTKGADVKIVLRKLNAFQISRKWSLDKDGRLAWKARHGFVMNYEGDVYGQSGRLYLTYGPASSDIAFWSFSKLPQEEEGFMTSLSSTCLYFIRSKREKCQYMTADFKGTGVHLRPLEHDLLEKQLWYWSGSSIHLTTNGHFLGVSGNAISLSAYDEKIRLPAWTLESDHIKLSNDKLFIYVDFEDDGKITASRSHYLSLELINYQTYNQSTVEECSIQPTESTTFFFIRSQLFNCKLLTEAGLENTPIFKAFNEDDIESQLWFSNSNHIVNLKTGFVLHVKGGDQVHGATVVLKQYQRFANNQKWEFKKDMINYKASDNCVLDKSMTSDNVIVWCHAHGGSNQRWDIVMVYDKVDQEVLCLFFLKHNVRPCELLTKYDSSYTRKPDANLRPVSQVYFKDQVWYWKGQTIVNYASGLALESFDNGKVSLREINGRYSQKWKQDGLKVVPLVMPHLSLGLDSKSGQLALMYDVSDNTKWTFVDFDNAIEQPSLLSCEGDLSNAVPYFIKSENGHCYVLSELQNGDVELIKAGETDANQAWFILRRHIISASSGRALSVDEVLNGVPVRTNEKLEHDTKQHWARTGFAVKVSSAEKTRLLDTYNGVTVWNEDGSQGQKWAWLKARDVQDDPRLLRCSKCFDKDEELASEIISYIPIFSWLYALIRAPVYAGKGCEEVAVETLEGLAIDLALDLGVALATVATGGAASAAALGVKTAVKSGVKAGLKVAVKAATSSVKLALRQAIRTGTVTLKNGLKKTVVNWSKRGLGKLKATLKTNIKTFKQLPSMSKSFVIRSGSSLKHISFNMYSRLKSFKTFKSSLIGGTKRLPSKIKKKLKHIGNSLAERADNKIRQVDDLKNRKSMSKLRCKRGGKGKCTPRKNWLPPNTNSKAFIDNPPAEVADNFKKMLNIANSKSKGQRANIGLTRFTEDGSSEIVDNSVKSRTLNQVKHRNEQSVDVNHEKLPLSEVPVDHTHTEIPLLNGYDDVIRKNCPQCELYLWTKNSPCTVKKQVGDVTPKSCFAMILEKCYRFVIVESKLKTCHVGFENFYGKKSEADNKDWFMKELTSLRNTRKYLAENNKWTIPDQARRNVDSFVKFYMISP